MSRQSWLLFVAAAASARACSTSPVAYSEVEAAAARLGCRLSARGPGEEEPSLLGYSDGFTLPTGVRRYSGYWSRSRLNRDGRRYAAVPKLDQHGLGLLLSVGVACLLLERRAQLLAIYDEPRQHATLVRYYRRLGFAALREVGDGAGSFGDQLAWGGVGTLMETDVSAFRRRWGASVRRLGRAADGGEEQLGDAGGGEEETRAARV
ncbi:hypothetical protein EMIHUDRAFT_199585 [Emiliania huxleyi CCMP1516]|uniref:N-acetyltransferase domain-containing protein n=2 Tax=Emiliania huxleyi TaxID=2903 RepID=A0A0D3KZV7_EMIH1|nr:hypothetical protein EMIHUDRAFT_199585 [Emiliania huxleyi CCMP1516]EOD41292.1 hypothetical protein EMIHUDRAFT_199585 [Emiliania huxleyi CCMP1516]|eukprot:XP_005793721.1 hypothetical protein EMIHUDRAFT_199585 [Emiliania huxleyi CCMP1516]